MKKLSILAVVAVVLLAAAIILTSCGFVLGKEAKGAGVIRVFVGSVYDDERVEAAKKNAGLEKAITLNTGKTYVELEMTEADTSDINTKGQKFVEALKADYADAELVYAETYSGNDEAVYLPKLICAIIVFAVIAYVFGGFRYGWIKSFAALLPALCAIGATWLVGVLVSCFSSFTIKAAGIVVASGILTYLFAMVRYADAVEKICEKTVLAVALVAVIAAVALFLVGGCAVSMYALILVAAVAALGFGVYAAPAVD